MKILAIDVGGTHVKVLATGRKKPIKIRSGPKMSAREMVRAVRQGTTGWRYAVVSIGYPGPVLHGKPVSEPSNLGGGLGGVRLQEGVRASRSRDQRRRHAGAGQLQGRPHALPRAGHGARLCAHRRRRAGADGAGAPAL